MKNLMRTNLLLIVFLFISSLSFGQKFGAVKDTVALKNSIDKMSNEIKSIESDFTQVKKLSMLSENITSTGHFYFQKENLLRWEYFKPYSYIIVINQSKITIKDDNKTKKYDMNSNKVFKEINDVMMACVNGDILHSGKFKIKYAEGDVEYQLQLHPKAKAMQGSIKEIFIYFDKKVSSVTRIEIVEPSDDSTSIEFTNKKNNQSISADKFILK